MKSIKCILAGLVLVAIAVVASAADGIKPDAPFQVPLSIGGQDSAGKAVVAGDLLKVTEPKAFNYNFKLIEDSPIPPPVQQAKYVVVVGKHKTRTPDQAAVLRDATLREIVGAGNWWLFDVSEQSPWVDLAKADAAKAGKDPASEPWWMFAKADWTVVKSEAVPQGLATIQARLLEFLPDNRAVPTGRLMGCLPRTTKCGAGKFPPMADSYLIPRKNWKPVDMRHLVPRIKDQDGTNSCCAHAVVDALEFVRSSNGMPDESISAASIYRWGNGGRDQGMTIEDGCAAAANHGALPSSKYPDLNWRAKYPADGAKIAEGYKLSEWVDCASTDYIGSAIQRGHPVVIGVFWSGGGGHAILVVGWSAEKGWLIQNSWGSDWGDAGFGWLPESQVARGIAYFGAFAAVVTTRPDTDPKPKAKTGSRFQQQWINRWNWPKLAPLWSRKASSCPGGNCPASTAP